MRTFAIILMLFFARIISAQVVFNEIQISPTSERFVELYNSGGTNVDLTGWYIQRKTATGSSFGSLITSTQFKDKIIKANDYFLISRDQRENSDIVIDNLTLTESNTIRMRDSNGADIDQVVWTTIDEGKSYQKMLANEWTVSPPTPGTANGGEESSQGAVFPGILPVEKPPSPLSSFPVEPQIIASVGETVRNTIAGAPTVFSGKVFGLKKEPIENARMVWSFGDGGSTEGQSVAHIYYYPGEYTVVLTVASGFYSASARVRVTVSVPQLMLRTGGDNIRSFVSIENQSDSEVDLSGWKINAQDRNFIFPQNTVLGARETASFASEVTGLVTPFGSSASLHFPNGTLVPLYQEKTPSLGATSLSSERLLEKMISKQSASPSLLRGSQNGEQAASVRNALSNPLTSSRTLAPTKEGRGWLWYLVVGALGALAFIGFRSSRILAKNDVADEYEIIEDNEEKDTENNGPSLRRDKIPF